MKVILKADIKGVGKKDEVINASDGYVRNFLFPKNLAVEANAENIVCLDFFLAIIVFTPCFWYSNSVRFCSMRKKKWQ